jgi:hypothetical protein
MSVGFGFSVGDVITTLELVGTVIDALRDSSHAGASFRSLISELYALESTLLQVKRLELDEEQRESKLALYQAASRCQSTIDIYWKGVQKYQPHLQRGGTNSRIRDGWAKIKWALCKQDELDMFRAKIRAHTNCLNILLSTIQLGAQTMDRHTRDAQYRSLTQKMLHLASESMSKLDTTINLQSQIIEQGRALLKSSAQILQTNLQVFRMIYNI